MLFTETIILYLVCATLAIKVREHARVDMPAFFERNRRVIFGAMAAGSLSGMILNFMGRNFVANSDDWIKADAAILPALVVIAVAALSKPKWMHLAAGLAYMGLTLLVFVTVAVQQGIVRLMSVAEFPPVACTFSAKTGCFLLPSRLPLVIHVFPIEMQLPKLSRVIDTNPSWFSRNCPPTPKWIRFHRSPGTTAPTMTGSLPTVLSRRAVRRTQIEA